MDGQASGHPASSRTRNGVLVLGGYGLRVAVERRHLVVEGGVCEERYRGRLPKATAELERLVVLGHTGFVTLEALRWLKDVGAAFVQVDVDGQVIAASAPAGLNDARLRRAQALAPSNGVGMKVARELARRKLEAQLAVIARFTDGQSAAAVIGSSLGTMERALTPARLRLLEADAAAAYWKAWASVAVQFVRREEARVPEHWRTFGTRTSPLSRSPRLAANPANALLNYLYAVLEGEARIAALTMGLDPGMGVSHADQPNRDSLALDLMEPLRPEVDAHVLELLKRQVFRAADFFETRQGVCRVLPPLTHLLAETAPQWAQRIAPIAEWAAAAFTLASGSRVRRLPTLLTQAHRSAGRDGLRRQLPKKPEALKPALIAACRMCGEILPLPGRSYCDDCRRVIKTEGLATFKASGPAALARLMAEGRDPTHGGEAARKRAASLARRQYEAARWERSHTRPGREEFRRTVLPGLQSVPLRRMANATGLSIRYCSLIRRGLYVPHPRHWVALTRAGTKTQEGFDSGMTS